MGGGGNIDVRNFRELGAWRGIGAQVVVAALMLVAGYLAWANHRSDASSDLVAAPGASSRPSDSGPLDDSPGADGTAEPAARASGRVDQPVASTPNRSALLTNRSSTTTAEPETNSSSTAATRRETAPATATSPSTNRTTTTGQSITTEQTTPTTSPATASSITTQVTATTKGTTTTQVTTTTRPTTTTRQTTTTQRTTTTAGRPSPVNCGLEGGVSSQVAGTDIWFVVDNRTAYDFDLFWLDYDGRRVSYGTVGAGTRFRQQTFATHPWVLADPGSGHCRYLLSEPSTGLVLTID